jgi:hypothetical protein
MVKNIEINFEDIYNPMVYNKTYENPNKKILTSKKSTDVSTQDVVLDPLCERLFKCCCDFLLCK